MADESTAMLNPPVKFEKVVAEPVGLIFLISYAPATYKFAEASTATAFGLSNVPDRVETLPVEVIFSNQIIKIVCNIQVGR